MSSYFKNKGQKRKYTYILLNLRATIRRLKKQKKNKKSELMIVKIIF